MIDPTLISPGNAMFSEIAEAIGLELQQSETEVFSHQAWLATIAGHNIDIPLFWSKLVIWLLIDTTYGVVRYYPEGRKEIEQVASLFKQVTEGTKPIDNTWELAGNKARSIAVALAGDRRNKSRDVYQKIKAGMCAYFAAESMREKNLNPYCQENLVYFMVISGAIQTYFEAGGEELAYQVTVAVKDKFFDLIWESEISGG